MGFFKKIKKWMTDYPGEPKVTFMEVLAPQASEMSATEQIMRYGLPFHIKWKSTEARNDN